MANIQDNLVVTPDMILPGHETGLPHVFPTMTTTHAKRHYSLVQSKPKQSARASSNKSVQADNDKAGYTPNSSAQVLPESPKPQPEIITKVKESTDKAHHKVVEVDIVRIKPSGADTAAVTPQIATTKNPLKPAETEVSTTPEHPIVHISPLHKSLVPPVHKSMPPTTPSRNVPDWQSHITNSSENKTTADDPPDMFDLAKEHPETFGSFQVLTADELKRDKQSRKNI